ncbi:MAG: response regulator [Elusimicrobia bacterium]|nr:response regulator [Elusimicrobiota bacterium]
MEKAQEGRTDKPFDCGCDRALFVNKANRFEPALLRIEAGGAVFRCRVNHNGLFIKQVEKLPKTARQSVMVMLEGRSLTARYKKAKFNCLWIYSISLGLDECRGDLKEAILELPGVIWERIQSASRHAVADNNRASQKTVLLVDDEIMVNKLLSLVLERKAADLRVLTAENGQDGLEILYREKVDLLLLNLSMPVMDGFQVFEVISKDEGLRKIPVIFSTGTNFEYTGYERSFFRSAG